jgi:regulatory protein
LAEWLRGRGLGEEEIAEALAALIEAELLDDARFARRYAEDKRELAGWGPARIAEALRARGVREPLIEAALAEEDAEAQLARAAVVLEERGAPVATEVERQRALSLLARRGFPLELAYAAVRGRQRAA